MSRARARSLTAKENRPVAMKLFWFTVCMIAVPIATFYAVYWSLPPEHARRNVWRCDAAARPQSARPPLSHARRRAMQRDRRGDRGQRGQYRVRCLSVPRTRARRRRSQLARWLETETRSAAG